MALALPRFRVESSFELGEALRRVGVVRAFSPEADFAVISREPGFSIQDLLHEAVVDVDEHGTEAAAATATIIVGAALRRPKPIEFRVDRPFLFLNANKPTGSILFLGRVVDPSAQESVVTTARSAIERS